MARVLKRPVDKDNALSLSRAEFKKLDSGGNRSFVTLARHLRLVATNICLGFHDAMARNVLIFFVGSDPF